MKKIVLLLSFLIFSLTTFSQTKVVTNNKLIINHGDLIIYLTNDTCTSVTKQTLKYTDFLKLDSDRDDKWFQDTYKGKYSKQPYVYSGYDLGHLTPSHITSYNDTFNHLSFSLFNQAPQVASFNRGKWAQLEGHVEDSIAKYKSNAIIITGVIYDPIFKKYLGKSKIPIPVSYYKVLIIKNKTWCWIGSNHNGNVIPITLVELNGVLKKNKMNLILK